MRGEIRGERKESISATTKGFQQLSTPLRFVWMERLLNLLTSEFSLVRSCYSCGQISSTALWLVPYLKTNIWKPKKGTQGSKLCGIIFSLGLLCWLIFPGNSDTPFHTILVHIPFHSRGQWFHFTAQFRRYIYYGAITVTANYEIPVVLKTNQNWKRKHWHWNASFVKSCIGTEKNFHWKIKHTIFLIHLSCQSFVFLLLSAFFQWQFPSNDSLKKLLGLEEPLPNLHNISSEFTFTLSGFVRKTKTKQICEWFGWYFQHL